MGPSDDTGERDDESEEGRPEVERRAGEEDADERGDTPAAEGADVSTTGSGDSESRRIEADDEAFAEAKRDVDRATEEDDEDETRRLLNEARERLDDADSAPDDAVEKLGRRIDRLLAANEERDQYETSVGASMNPEDEDAP